MGPTQINGLPAHALLVHVVVVLVPLTALLTVAAACWPAVRHRLGIGLPLLALVMVISVPVTTNAGGWLLHRVPFTPLVLAHVRLGDDMLPWAIALFIAALAVWGLRFVEPLPARPAGTAAPGAPPDPGAAQPGSAAPEPGRSRVAALLAERRRAPAGHRQWVLLSAVVGVLAVVVAAGTVVQCYRVGDSGAHAVWTGRYSQQPLPRTGPAPG